MDNQELLFPHCIMCHEPIGEPGGFPQPMRIHFYGPLCLLCYLKNMRVLQSGYLTIGGKGYDELGLAPRRVEA